jgi:hypothetical protein
LRCFEKVLLKIIFDSLYIKKNHYGTNYNKKAFFLPNNFFSYCKKTYFSWKSLFKLFNVIITIFIMCSKWVLFILRMIFTTKQLSSLVGMDQTSSWTLKISKNFDFFLNLLFGFERINSVVMIFLYGLVHQNWYQKELNFRP